jgi:hypothetical protein
MKLSVNNVIVLDPKSTEIYATLQNSCCHEMASLWSLGEICLRRRKQSMDFEAFCKSEPRITVRFVPTVRRPLKLVIPRQDESHDRTTIRQHLKIGVLPGRVSIDDAIFGVWQWSQLCGSTLASTGERRRVRRRFDL